MRDEQEVRGGSDRRMNETRGERRRRQLEVTGGGDESIHSKRAEL